MYTQPFVRLLVLLAAVSPALVSARPVNMVDVVEVGDDGSLIHRSVDQSVAFAGRPDNSTGTWLNDAYEDGTESDDNDDVEEVNDTDDDNETEDDEGDFSALARTRPRPRPAPARPRPAPARPRPAPARPRPAPARPTAYTLDCRLVPEVCSNICFFQFCKRGSTTQVPKRGRTVAAACKKSPNKCSANFKGSGTSAGGAGAFTGAFPQTGFQCDEFPLASTTAGGSANAATRCVPARQNGSAGGKFKFPVGRPVRTVLLNMASAPFYCNRNCNAPGDTNGRQE